MLKLMEPTEVKKAVIAKGSKFATVKFLKKNGEERVVNGLFKPLSKIKGGDKGDEVSQRLKDNGLIPIYCVSEESWKSFKEDRVVSLR